MTADATIHVNEMRTMYNVRFQYVNQLYLAPVIHVQFMDSDRFEEVDTTCYDLATVPTGTTCVGKNDGGPPTYSRYELSGFDLNQASGTTFDLYLFAKTKNDAGQTATMQVTVSDELDDTTNKLTDQSSHTITLDANVLSPTSYALSTFKKPKVELRAGEYSPLTFVIKPAGTYPASSTVNLASMIVVDFPQLGTFTQASGSFLDCRINDGTTNHLSAKCEFIAATPTPTPDKIKMWMPATLAVQAGTEYTVTITTLDATDPSHIGFRAPGTAGDYQFSVYMYENEASGTIVEFNEAWVEVPPTRFVSVDVKSYCKVQDQYNVLDILFTTTTELIATDSNSEPGVIFIEFPVS